MLKILIVSIEKIQLVPFVQMAIDNKIELALAETIEEGYNAFLFYDDHLAVIVISLFIPALRSYVRLLFDKIKRIGFKGQIISCNSISEALPAIQALVL